jgi:DNA-directed RNA polymerase alpha subunit
MKIILEFDSDKEMLTWVKRKYEAISERKKALEELQTETTNKLLENPIENLELMCAAENALKRQGLTSFGHLVALRRTDLMKIKGLGARGITNIESGLDNFGLKLKPRF